MKPRRAGRRRQWVAIQAAVKTKTTTGFTEAWSTVYETWAAVEPVTSSPSERPVAQTTQAPATHVVELDYDSRVTVKHRVLYGTRALHIVAPPQNVEERDETLVLACEERVA